MHRFFHLIKHILKKFREAGLRNTMSLALLKASKIVAKPSLTKHITLENFSSTALPIVYSIVLRGLQQRAIRPVTAELKQLRTTKALHFLWIVPFFSKGSGGHKNLFRFVKGLEDCGHKCTIYILLTEPELGIEASKIRSLIQEYFEDIEADVKLFETTCLANISADVVVATSWITAYAALFFDAALNLYFVQDYEPLFFSSGSYFHLAKNTYDFGFHHITLGPWLTSLLRNEHQADADFYDIVVDHSIYYPRQEISNSHIRKLSQKNGLKICFYGRSVTPRRCFEIVVMALYAFTQRVSDVTIACYGWSEIPSLPFECVNLGSLEVEDLAELYSSFDICIAPSSTNLALVAHEVMACGCVLMDLDVQNTSLNLWHLKNCYLTKPDPVAMYEGLLELFYNPHLLAELKIKSLDYAKNIESWDEQVKRFEKLVLSHFSFTG